MMSKSTTLAALLAVSAAGCVASDGIEDGDVTKAGWGKADSSAEAVFVNMEFDGEMLSNSSFNAKSQIEDQMLYTIGHLNGSRGVGRLDRLKLTDIETESVAGKTKISYHAVLPVAWGNKSNVPSTYKFTLPRQADFSGQEEFTAKYKDSCVDFGAHDVDSGSMWYYYRPGRSNCQLADEDVVRVTADVSVSPSNTTGKFPEYDKVWEDDALKVIAVFGKYEDGETSNSDAGIAAYNRFLRLMQTEFAALSLATTPSSVPSNPGVDVPDVTFSATLPNGKSVRIVALLVDNVRTAGPEFTTRYEALSPDADLIMYNGHAGLGSNIRALAQKGHWVADQYVMVFMNGCDTYAYVDTAINDAHAALNPDDPTGTKHVDMVTNALPSFFASMAGASTALIRGLLDEENPQTYEQMFRNIDSSQVILVSGEEDNTFVPGGTVGPTDPAWEGLDVANAVVRNQELHFESPTLPAGRYVYELTGDADADLYVRIGQAPTAERFDCRPYKSGSNESCVVELPAAGKIFAMVRGYASGSSNFALLAGPE